MEFEVEATVTIRRTLTFRIKAGRAKYAEETARRMATRIIGEVLNESDQVNIVVGIPKPL